MCSDFIWNDKTAQTVPQLEYSVSPKLRLFLANNGYVITLIDVINGYPVCFSKKNLIVSCSCVHFTQQLRRIFLSAAYINKARLNMLFLVFVR